VGEQESDLLLTADSVVSAPVVKEVVVDSCVVLRCSCFQHADSRLEGGSELVETGRVRLEACSVKATLGGGLKACLPVGLCLLRSVLIAFTAGKRYGYTHIEASFVAGRQASTQLSRGSDR